MPEHVGKNIREVWDFRLSSAIPQLRRDLGPTWVVQIMSKAQPDYDPSNPETLAKPLAEHDTGVAVVTGGDAENAAGIIACYDWLRTVRDQYALPDIEERKPIVAGIRQREEEIHALNAQLSEG